MKPREFYTFIILLLLGFFVIFGGTALILSSYQMNVSTREQTKESKEIRSQLSKHTCRLLNKEDKEWNPIFGVEALKYAGYKQVMPVKCGPYVTSLYVRAESLENDADIKLRYFALKESYSELESGFQVDGKEAPLVFGAVADDQSSCKWSEYTKKKCSDVFYLGRRWKLTLSELLDLL